MAPRSRSGQAVTLDTLLAFGFRGVLSFWTAGELADDELAACAREVALAILLGVVSGQPKLEDEPPRPVSK